MDDDADGEAEKAVDLAHPFSITLGEIIIDGHDVDAAAGKRVQVCGKCSDESLAFAGLHLGDLALMKNTSADQLHVKVAHAHDAAACFPHDGKGLRHESVESAFFCGVEDVGVGFRIDALGCFGDPGTKLHGLFAKLLVGQSFHLGLEGVHLANDGEQTFDGPLVGSTKDFGDNTINHGMVPLGWARIGAEYRALGQSEASAVLRRGSNLYGP